MNQVKVFTTGGTEEHRGKAFLPFSPDGTAGHWFPLCSSVPPVVKNFAGREAPFDAITSVPVLIDKNFRYFLKIFLHLWKFAVISQLRTNFTENARESLLPWEPRKASRGRRGGESESPEEEAIEIGNSYRNH